MPAVKSILTVASVTLGLVLAAAPPVAAETSSGRSGTYGFSAPLPPDAFKAPQTHGETLRPEASVQPCPPNYALSPSGGCVRGTDTTARAARPDRLSSSQPQSLLCTVECGSDFALRAPRRFRPTANIAD
jgi:hypothetical protein